jgi:hypothetical protein
VSRLTNVNQPLELNTNATKPDIMAFCYHLILILLKQTQMNVHQCLDGLITDAVIDDANGGGTKYPNEA